MSWSFYGVGKPKALADKAVAELGRVKCSEPEESIKRKVEEIILASLDACPPNAAVRITVQGSQQSTAFGAPGALNALDLKIEPLYGFVED